MDQTLVASIRKSLEAKSTEELRQLGEGQDQAGRSPEELEAIRQLLHERRSRGTRAMLALASAAVLGTLAAAGAWWQLGPDYLFIFLCGAGGAVLGFASWYIPGLGGPA